MFISLVDIEVTSPNYRLGNTFSFHGNRSKTYDTDNRLEHFATA